MEKITNMLFYDLDLSNISQSEFRQLETELEKSRGQFLNKEEREVLIEYRKLNKKYRNMALTRIYELQNEMKIENAIHR